jgi:superfamily I DNA/RNA helicase
VVKRLLKPEQGLLFLADDPMQSIYRYYSWREKGVPVVGRSRWLRIPYRTTREIYQAAYEIIQGDEVLKSAIENETGLMVEPDLEVLRRGDRPKLKRFDRLEDEASFIKSEIAQLRILGINPEEIAVLSRKKNSVKRIQNLLRGSGVTIDTFHGSKGMEYEVIFLSQMQDTFQQIGSDQELSQERRTVYMAMTRARNSLHLCFEGAWPEQMRGALELLDRV